MDFDLRHVDIGHMRWTMFVILLVIAPHVSAEDGYVIQPGQWPMQLSQVNGEQGTQQIVFSSQHIVVETNMLETPKIFIDKNSVVYAPSSAVVRAKPKVYTHPELADEVQKFYLQGVGNYAFWATLIGIAAAIQ